MPDRCPSHAPVAHKSADQCWLIANSTKKKFKILRLKVGYCKSFFSLKNWLKVSNWYKNSVKNELKNNVEKLVKKSTPSPWKRQKTISSALLCATGVWGLSLFVYFTRFCYFVDQVIYILIRSSPNNNFYKDFIKKMNKS